MVSHQSKYRQLSELHHRVPLFFQPWWLDVVCKTWDVALAEKDKAIEAIFPYQKETKAGLKLLRNPPLCPYLGPYFLFQESNQRSQWNREEKVFSKLWPQLPKWDYFQLSTIPDFSNFLLFHEKGFSNTNHLTYRLNLAPDVQSLFSQIRPRLRQYIKKAEQQLTVKKTTKPDWSLFVSWHQRAFDKKKTPYPFSLSLFKNIFKQAESHGSSLFQTAYDEHKSPVAMLWTPFDNTSAYHLLAATAPTNTMNGAMALLVWNAIKIMKEKSKKYYDFEGSMDKGIEAFFRKFGGERKAYLEFEQSRSKIWKLKKELLG